MITFALACTWGAVLTVMAAAGATWPVRYPARHRAED